MTDKPPRPSASPTTTKLHFKRPPSHATPRYEKELNLVELPKVDVIHLETEAIQQPMQYLIPTINERPQFEGKKIKDQLGWRIAIQKETKEEKNLLLSRI